MNRETVLAVKNHIIDLIFEAIQNNLTGQANLKSQIPMIKTYGTAGWLCIYDSSLQEVVPMG